MEVHVARAVRRLMAEILRPIRRVGNLGSRTEYGAHIRRERSQFIYCRIDPRGRAICVSPRSSRPDQERVDPARHLRKPRIVQDHAPIGPLARPGIVHRARTKREITQLGVAEKAPHLRRGKG